MALSRAAAAAARKAAKSRGLKGNRADDGSMLSAEQLQELRAKTPGYWDKRTAILMEDEIPLLNDGELNRAWRDIHEEIAELQELSAQMQERNWVGYDIEKYNTQMNQAKERLSIIEDEMEARGVDVKARTEAEAYKGG